MPALSGLICPACRAGQLLSGLAGAISCGACGASVRTEQGIPILAHHWRALQADVEAARQVKPNWYQDEQPAEQVSPWRHHVRKRREYVERVIRRHLAASRLPRAARLLDFGCGDGNNLVWLSKYSDAVYGSDYNLLRLVRAQAQNPGATIFAADILDFPAENNAFDVIFFNHVIEHIPDDACALATVHRILRPGGLLVLGTPNEGSWWWQLAYRRDPASLQNTDHCHFYTAATIGAKVTASGLTLEETHHIGWGPPDWKLDGRIRRYKLVDDLFTIVGRTFLPTQASSLYILATKPPA
ncbi:MAG: class I SAM-dependent methyltransferase [Acidobacteriota bacterium]|nr:class I SAM-dependent methyltransferase [Acidobacteriota bacterium]